MNKNNYIIDISGLNKKYELKDRKSIEIISNLNFRLKPRAKIAIIGPSGSGKTTLLNILGLLDKQYDGKYFFNGKNVKSFTEVQTNKIRGLSIGFIHQFFHLIPELSVIENVMLPVLINNKEKNAFELSRKILFEFGLKDRINFKPLKLSGGEQQRVAIARSLINNPDIILADEMTGNLDEQTANNIFNFFINYLEQNKKTLVYVTHNKKFSQFADEIYKFNNKTIILENE